MKTQIKVSEHQKEEIRFKNEIIQEFFNRFTRKREFVYFEWIDNLKIGDIVNYMMSAVNTTIEEYNDKLIKQNRTDKTL